MKTSGVYGWRNIITHKWYVGSSIHIKRRKATHVRELNKGTHTGSKLLRAWNKYGADAFEFWVIEECEPTRQELLEKEQYWIDSMDSYYNGYNTLQKAGSNLGRVSTPEQIARQKETMRARGRYVCSPETRKLIGDTQRGVPRGPMSEAQKELLRKPKSPKSMEEMARFLQWRQENRGARFSEVTCNKYGIPFLGRDPKPCICCGEVTTVKGATCSRKCLATVKSRNAIEACKRRGLTLSSKVCMVCGVSITSNRATCGRTCLKELQRMNSLKPIKMGHCLICGTEFMRNRSNKGNKTCGRECFKELSRRTLLKRYADGEKFGFKEGNIYGNNG